MEGLEEELKRLGSMAMRQLREKYGARFADEFGTTHRQYLIRRIAWRLQAAAYGGLSVEALCRAREIANEGELRSGSPARRHGNSKPVEITKTSRERDPRLPAVGTELTRTYRSRTISVTVSPAGFTYQGRAYGSLSAVAYAATGTRWNGLLFFGIAKRGDSRRGAKERAA